MRVLTRFNLLPKQPGVYHAFPTLLRVGGRIWLGCRTGRAGPGHGDRGRVRLFCSDAEAPTLWDEASLSLSPEDDEWNDLDAILSGPFGEEVLLATRDWGPRGNRPYLSRLPAAATPPGQATRLPLAGQLTGRAVGLEVCACFGHVQRSESGALLMPIYGFMPGEPRPAPLLLASDNGSLWDLRARLVDSGREERFFNEWSLLARGGGRWLAVVRTNASPSPLHWCESDDDGHTFGPLLPTGLFGHAPMLCEMNGRTVLLYRDLEEERPGVALALEEGAGRWRRMGRVFDYCGGVYNGGYGDLLPLGPDRLLVVAYLSDQDESPWIDGAVVELSA